MIGERKIGITAIKVVKDERPLEDRDTQLGISLGVTVVGLTNAWLPTSSGARRSVAQFVKSKRRFEVGNLPEGCFLGPDIVANVEGNFPSEQVLLHQETLFGDGWTFEAIREEEEPVGWVGIWRLWRTESIVWPKEDDS